VRTPHSRARRFLFTAPIELTDVESGAQVVAVTLDLSVFGCQVGNRVLQCLPDVVTHEHLRHWEKALPCKKEHISMWV
jgi:hypothetical protein